MQRRAESGSGAARREWPWPIVVQSLAAAAVFLVYHWALRRQMLAGGLVLGAVGPGTKVYRLVPLYMHAAPHLKTGLLLAALALAAFALWLIHKKGTSLFFGWFACLALLVAMVDGGPRTIWRPYELLASSDYIGAIDRVESPRRFLADYLVLLPTLPLHCQVHPPGGVLFLWTVTRLTGGGVAACALATILAAALAAPAAYLLAREVLDERAARWAVGLYLVAPNVMLYAATSMDSVFAVPMIWTIALLWRARMHRPWFEGWLAGIAASLAALMTFSAAFLAVWAASMLAITALFDRRRLSSTLKALSAAALAACLFHLALWLYSGYSLPATLLAAIDRHHAIMQGGNYGSARQYVHLAVGNLVALLVASGIPLGVLFVRRLYKDFRSTGATDQAGWLNLSFAAALAVLTAAPLYTLEVERIWLFMVPLIAVAAARELDYSQLPRVTSEPAVVYAMTAFQLLAMEASLDTIW